MHKDTKGKLRLDLIPPLSKEAIAKVREFGVTKYPDAWGWLDSVSANDLITAAERHIHYFRKGEELDPESGLPHLWHALASLGMAIEIKGK